MPFGVDYAWSHPSPQAILALGYRFVLRYLSPDGSKNLTAGELDGLHKAGLDVAVVWEGAPQRPLSGATAGQRDGERAKAMYDALGAPADAAIYAAYDWDVQPGQMAACLQYQTAFAAAIHPHPDGVYGGFRICNYILGARYRWQTGAWSGRQRARYLSLYQHAEQVTIDGVVCDVNEQLGPFGAWPAVLPTVEEATKMLNAPVAAVAKTPDDKGYLILAEDFGLYAFGNAPFFGHPNDGDDKHGHSGAKAAALELTSSGQGYWIFAADGGVFTFGDAEFYGAAV